MVVYSHVMAIVTDGNWIFRWFWAINQFNSIESIIVRWTQITLKTTTASYLPMRENSLCQSVSHRQSPQGMPQMLWLDTHSQTISIWAHTSIALFDIKSRESESKSTTMNDGDDDGIRAHRSNAVKCDNNTIKSWSYWQLVQYSLLSACHSFISWFDHTCSYLHYFVCFDFLILLSLSLNFCLQTHFQSNPSILSI